MVLEKVGTKIITAWVKAGEKSLLATRPVKVNIAELKLAPKLEGDTVSIAKKVETWFTINNKPPVARAGLTNVSEHHNFHALNSTYNITLEEQIRLLRLKHADNPERLVKAIDRAKVRDAGGQVEIFESNQEFKKIMPQPCDSVVYRGRSRRIGDELGCDLDIIKNAKVGDEIIPTRGFAYAAHHKAGAAQWFGANEPGFEGVLYEIRVPKGSQISVNMEHGGEAVFPGFSRYKIISKETRYIKSYANEFRHTGEARPYNHVVLEYIPDIPTKVPDEVMQLAQKPLF